MAIRTTLLLASLALAAALVVTTTSAAQQARPSGLDDSACVLLFHAGAGGPVGGDSGHRVDRQVIPPTICVDFSCWKEQRQADGMTKCVYGRAARLTVNSNRSARAAQGVVSRALAAGYHRVSVRADKAAAKEEHGGLSIVMAVGKTTALLGLGPASDTDPSPSWPGVKAEALVEAKTIAGRLRRTGCPGNWRRC